MLQRIQNLEKAVRYLAEYVSGYDSSLIGMAREIHKQLTVQEPSIDTRINSALIKGGFKDYEIKQLEQCLRYCLHRTKAHNFCGLSKTGIREKEINNLLEKIK